MKASEFLRRAKRYTDRLGLRYRWAPARGKGSHGTLFIGETGRTTVQNLSREIPSGTFRAMCSQLSIDPKEL